MSSKLPSDFRDVGSEAITAKTFGPPWASVNDAMHCSDCKDMFTLRKWKHHCRACGKVFCNSCSSWRLPLPSLGYSEKVRICNDCFFAGFSSVNDLVENLDVKNQMNSDLKKALEEHVSMIGTFKAFLLALEGELIAEKLVPRINDDSFEDMMWQTDQGVKSLIQKHQAANLKVEKLTAEIRYQQEDVKRKTDEINSLRKQLSASNQEKQQLQEYCDGYSYLLQINNDQAETINSMKLQVEGLIARCTSMEAAQKNRRESAEGRKLDPIPVKWHKRLFRSDATKFDASKSVVESGDMVSISVTLAEGNTALIPLHSRRQPARLTTLRRRCRNCLFCHVQ